MKIKMNKIMYVDYETLFQSIISFFWLLEED